MRKIVAKRLAAVVLSAILLMMGFSLPISAFGSSKDPIILLPGYASVQIFANPQTNPPYATRSGKLSKSQIWQPDYVKLALNPLKEATNLLNALTINPDGSRDNNSAPYPTKAKDSSLAAIKAWAYNGYSIDLAVVAEEFATQMSKEVGSQYADDNVFIFKSDWRLTNVSAAKQLDTYIQDVKSITGSKHVRLFGSSHGGQLAAVYLYLYGKKNDVSKIVMEFPALGGSSMLTDLLLGQNFHVNTSEVVRFLLASAEIEGDFDAITKRVDLDSFGVYATEILQTKAIPVLKSWGGFIDLIPASDYNKVKAHLLKDGTKWYWEADEDLLHQKIMPNYKKIFQEAQARGTEIYIVANHGNEPLFGTNTADSDAILDLVYTTGAKTVNGKIDAATAWLPKQTWFVAGQFHGLSFYDPYAMKLDSWIMFASNPLTVTSNPDFPQFGWTAMPKENIFVSFAKSPIGYVNKNSTQLIVQNLSRKHNLRVLYAYTTDVKSGKDGPIAFGIALLTSAKPGKTVTIPVKTNTAKNHQLIELSVVYLQAGEKLLPQTKTFLITVSN